jgi:outer membrane cobalamin receptor
LAQELTDTIAGRVHSLEDVTVTGRRAPRAAAATSPLQVFSQADIARMGALELSDAVRHFSGVSVKDYGGIGGLKTVSVRSLGAQHTGVSYDGVAVSDCQSGQVDLSRFSLDNVSELTMHIGQDDDIFQSAKMFASAGVLSIETAVPQFEASHPYRFTARVKTGSFGTANHSLYYARQLGSRLSASVYAEYLHADSNYPFRMWNGSKLIDSKRNNSRIDSYRAEANLFARLTPRQELKFKAYAYGSKRGLPGSVVYDNPYAVEQLYDRNYFGQLKYVNRISEKWKLQASAKYNFSWNRDTDHQAASDTDDRFRQTELYASGTLWAEPIQGLSFSLAEDLGLNHLNTTLEKCQYPTRVTSLTALAARYHTRRLTATASLLNTFITESVRLGTAADDRRRLSPSVSLAWRPLAESSWRLRAGYKDIFRVPTFNDLYYLVIGNSQLKPETTRQWNVGTTWSGHQSSAVPFVQLTVDGYYNRVNDKIIAIPTMFVWRMSNAGKVETYGLDANLQGEVKLSARERLFLTAAYNYMQAEDITSPTSKVWHHQIAYTPKHSGSASVTLQTRWVDLTYNLLYASERYSKAYNSSENRIEPYTDHSVTLARTFAWGRHSLRLQADALNLGNKNYEVVRFYPMPGRNYKLTIQYNI